MTCIHLHELYELCQMHDVKLGSSDLIRIVCRQCQVQEVCPAMLTDEYDSRVEALTEAPSAAQQPR